jgi:hypothetical protein
MDQYIGIHVERLEITTKFVTTRANIGLRKMERLSVCPSGASLAPGKTFLRLKTSLNLKGL